MPALPQHSLGLDATLPVSDSGVVVTPARISSSPDRHESGRLDHFIVDRKLGSGGMGAVYFARDASLDRPVAIKILPDELALKAEAQERFIREAQAQARLSSPHVVQIYFIGHVPASPGLSGPRSGLGSLYFAMELVDGGSLEQLLDRGERLDPEDARRLMIQVAAGLRDAHVAGIVHRDIKPGNLLLDRKRDVKIADFGLAKPRDPKLGLTREGAVLGTPLYMAPEQAMGEPLDHRADMYS
ncbi:MAG: serine/threonine-protein kinase, partial [Minicystis sp.]